MRATVIRDLIDNSIDGIKLKNNTKVGEDHSDRMSDVYAKLLNVGGSDDSVIRLDTNNGAKTHLVIYTVLFESTRHAIMKMYRSNDETEFLVFDSREGQDSYINGVFCIGAASAPTGSFYKLQVVGDAYIDGNVNVQSGKTITSPTSRCDASVKIISPALRSETYDISDSFLSSV